MKVLIIYGTTEGQTRKIARFMEDVLQEAGHMAAIADASDDPPSPGDYDVIIIGASIHIGKYQPAVISYIEKHLEAVSRLPSFFYSVCLAIASDIEEEHRNAEKITSNFLESVGWEPLWVKQIAGALKYTQYDFFKKLIMKMISKKEGRTIDTSQDHEFTNWEEVRSFTIEFIELAKKSPAPKAPHLLADS
jgi:menaquinone-dependent protoporphyrinogen oxidase